MWKDSNKTITLEGGTRKKGQIINLPYYYSVVFDL